MLANNLGEVDLAPNHSKCLSLQRRGWEYLAGTPQNKGRAESLNAGSVGHEEEHSLTVPTSSHVRLARFKQGVEDLFLREGCSRLRLGGYFLPLTDNKRRGGNS